MRVFKILKMPKIILMKFLGAVTTAPSFMPEKTILLSAPRGRVFSGISLLALIVVWGQSTPAHAGYCWVTDELDYGSTACTDSDSSTTCGRSSLRYYVSGVYNQNSAPNCTPPGGEVSDKNHFDQAISFATKKSGLCGDVDANGRCSDNDVYVDNITLTSVLSFDSNFNKKLVVGNTSPSVVSDAGSDLFDTYSDEYKAALMESKDYGLVYIDGKTRFNAGVSPVSCSSDSVVYFRNMALWTNGVQRDEIFSGSCNDAGGNLVCAGTKLDSPLTNPSAWCDGDNDGFSSDGGSTTSGYDYSDEDCNDNDASIHPDADEVCGDKKDNNCDGSVDEGCAGVLTKDGELEVTPTTSSVEAGKSQTYTVTLSEINSKLTVKMVLSGLHATMSANEVSINGESSGQVTVNTTQDTPIGSYGIKFMCTDDYYKVNIECSQTVTLTLSPGQTDNDADDDGFDNVDSGGSDCDDNDADINPLATEICGNDIDENCDGSTVDSCQSETSCDDNLDNDADGDVDCDDSDCSSTESCEATTDNDVDNDGYIDINDGGNDCNDNNAAINPGAAEVCGDNIDNNCDGTADGLTCIPDVDGDGYGDANSGGDDCNDTNSAINPAATELCQDGIDNNCDGVIDGADSISCAGTVLPPFGGTIQGGAGCSLNHSDSSNSIDSLLYLMATALFLAPALLRRAVLSKANLRSTKDHN